MSARSGHRCRCRRSGAWGAPVLMKQARDEPWTASPRTARTCEHAVNTPLRGSHVFDSPAHQCSPATRRESSARRQRVTCMAPREDAIGRRRPRHASNSRHADPAAPLRTSVTDAQRFTRAGADDACDAAHRENSSHAIGSGKSPTVRALPRQNSHIEMIKDARNDAWTPIADRQASQRAIRRTTRPDRQRERSDLSPRRGNPSIRAP